jgi:septal ring factor EnvC (AmiA/AmiB activator)
MSPDTKKTWSGVLKVSAVVLVLALGIWGFARKPVDRASSERVRTLEGRCVKLEQDYRTVAQARDKSRKELAALTEEVNRLQREVSDRESLLQERDALRRQVAQNERLAKQLADRTAERDQLTRDLNVTTAERDTVLSRYERLRKSLQTIMSQEDGPQGAAPAVPTSAGPSLQGNS